MAGTAAATATGVDPEAHAAAVVHVSESVDGARGRLELLAQQRSQLAAELLEVSYFVR